MNFIQTPSLEHTAVTKIAITTWSQQDIREHILKYIHSSNYIWHETELVVIKKASKLPLPKLLKEKVLDCVILAGLQLASWVDYHRHLVPVLPVTFVWTSLGTIDSLKTAQVLVQDETLLINRRFVLACTYCLEDEIRDLWGKLQCYEFEFIYRTRGATYLTFFWCQCIQERLKKYLCESYMLCDIFALMESTLSGNEAATRHFLEKLSEENFNIFIVAVARGVAEKMNKLNYRMKDFSNQRYSDVLLFLLSRMDAKQQTELFTTDSYAVLKSLLVWPWQGLFLETANSTWNFLSNQHYNDLLEEFAIWINFKRNNLLEVFVEFWHQTPDTYKDFVADQGGFGSLLLELYYRKDEKIIKLILKDSSSSVREKFIFGDNGRKICEYLVSCEEWDSIKILILECISSPEEMLKFRNKFTECIKLLNSNDMEKYQWDIFSHLLEDCCCIMREYR